MVREVLSLSMLSNSHSNDYYIQYSCYFLCHFHLDTLDSSLEAADDDQEEGGFWNLFVQLTTDLKSLKLLHFFTDHAVAEVAHQKVNMQYVQF